jgi:hypothetical protein
MCGAGPEPLMIAACGLYCGACRSHLKGRCPGCSGNTKASWCKVRTCVAEHGQKSCAECTIHPDPMECRLFDNIFARVIGLCFNSDRGACIRKIREIGPDGFAAFMAEHAIQSLPRRGQVP